MAASISFSRALPLQAMAGSDARPRPQVAELSAPTVALAQPARLGRTQLVSAVKALMSAATVAALTQVAAEEVGQARWVVALSDPSS